MDFSIPPDIHSLKIAMRDFASELDVDLERRETSGKFDRSLWSQCADQGVLSLAVPRHEDEWPYLRAVIAMEGFGYGAKDFGLAFGLNAQMWTVQLPLATFGTELQKEKYLLPMSEGTLIGAHAVTEEQAGSDTAAMQTVASKVEGGYEITGKKCLITLAPVADLFLVFAKSDGALGRWGG